jgi:hypothetical protein
MELGHSAAERCPWCDSLFEFFRTEFDRVSVFSGGGAYRFLLFFGQIDSDRVGVVSHGSLLGRVCVLKTISFAGVKKA